MSSRIVIITAPNIEVTSSLCSW